jgi:hypothetical protein
VRQLSKLGDARMPFKAAARVRRWARGRKASTVRAPTRSMGGLARSSRRAGIGGFAGAEAAFGEDGEKDVLTASRGIGIAAEETEHERDSGGKRGARGFGIGVPAGGPSLERREHVERLAGGGAGGDDANGGGVAEGAEIWFADAPGAEVGLALPREGVGDLLGAPLFGGVHPAFDPGKERSWVEGREGKK